MNQNQSRLEGVWQESFMSLASLIETGSKVWLDGVEPSAIEKHRAWGITGGTSNPAIISKIIGRGDFDHRMLNLIEDGLTDQQIAWELNDALVKSAQPSATNEFVYASPKVYNRRIDDMPAPTIVNEFNRKVDMAQLEQRLMDEGIKKFAEPQVAHLRLIAQKRATRSTRASVGNCSG
jgi:transaldolase